MNGRTKQSDIEWYLTRGFRLCLLDCSPNLPPKLRGKKPLKKNWNARDERHATLVDHALSGKNLGFVIPSNVLVIDVDPRNGGDKSLDLLEQDIGDIDLFDLYPAVSTGGGGWHIYCSKSKNEAVRKKVHRYKGIEFLTGNTTDGNGAQCVIPGGYHYVANDYYDWEEESAVDDKSFAPVPEALLRHIRRTDKLAEKPASTGTPNLSEDELKSLLDQIDVEDYRGKHDDWLSLMFACHHATGGEGRNVFVDWCVGDAAYAQDEGQIMYRWDSILDGDGPLVTYRTLLNAVRETGGEVPKGIQRKCDIADFDPVEFSAIEGFDDVVKAFDDDDDDLGSADDDVYAKESAEKEEVRKQTAKTKYDAVIVLATGLDEQSVTLSQIESIAKLCVGFDRVVISRIKDEIRKHTKLAAKVIDGAFEEIRKSTLRRDAFANVPKDLLEQLEVFSVDLMPVAVAKVLKEKYRHGHSICVGQDGAIYTYNGILWSKSNDQEIQQNLKWGVGQVTPEERDVAKGIQKSKTILMSSIRRLDFTTDPHPDYDVFNFKNCEVWVDGKTGERIKKAHKPTSKQLFVLPYEYDQKADCPIFSAALKETLAEYADADDVERHLFELYGYTLTSNKNHAVFVALVGGGGNGKGVILHALNSVLGPRALNTSLTDFGTGRSNHAFTQLFGKLALIDDDLEYNKKLPDSVLKKVSESKRLTADPKHKESFDFTSRAVCWMSTNSWPYIGDSSNGIRRRANIIHLTRDFIPGVNADTDLYPKVEAEAPGIFNRMVDGLIRLRDRGHFMTPAALNRTARLWETRTNPLAAHLVEYYSTGGKDGVTVTALYEAYREFVFSSGRSDRIAAPRYREMLEALGAKFDGDVPKIPDRLKKL